MQRLSVSDRRAFTLIELLVVIAIIALLAAILFPVFARARENARKSSCQSNLKQIGLGVLQYTQDFDEMFPHQHWFSGCNETNGTAVWQVAPYIKSTQVWVCPSKRATSSTDTGYGFNYMRIFGQTRSLADLRQSARLVMVTDADSAWLDGYWCPRSYPADSANQNYRFNSQKNKHLGTVNVAYADGHVKSSRASSMNWGSFYDVYDGSTSYSPCTGANTWNSAMATPAWDS